MLLFHLYIFVVSNSLGVNLSRLLVSLMVYNSANGQGHRMKVTWLIGLWKRHLRPRISSPVFTFRSPNFVLYLGFGLKWSHTKFGVKRSKPGRATLENVFWALFRLFLEMPVFHFSMFVIFYPITVKLHTVLFSSMAYKSMKFDGHSMRDTWLACFPKRHLRLLKCSPAFYPPDLKLQKKGVSVMLILLAKF